MKSVSTQEEKGEGVRVRRGEGRGEVERPVDRGRRERVD